jgi:hypothetical protein
MHTPTNKPDLMGVLMLRAARLGWCGCLAAWLVAGSTTADAGPQPEGMAFFEQKIRPVLIKECYGCHSAGAKAVKGGLRLDSRAGVIAGGDSGPAVVPGKPEESLLLDALRYDGLEMPPKGKLPPGVVADFERWVRLGAPDSREGPSAPSTRPAGLDVAAGRRFWAYQRPRLHESPRVADAGWPINEIDPFVLAKLEARRLHPAYDADRATLIRRLSYDLIGLPPSPEEVDAFVDDRGPDAYERLVERLLASPQFGERWGRHWLDVVRFAESLTLRGFVLKHAWRYRDYLISAFNTDRPFCRFVEEQVAGDLLPGASLVERREDLTATTFLALGNTNLEDQDKAQLEMDVVDEQLDTIGKAFLAQTIGCARCHDHKFDPIPTRDYYAMAGILRNTKTLEHANVSQWLEKPLPASVEQEAEIQAHEAEIAGLEARLRSARAGAGGRKAGSGGGAIAVGDLPGIVIDDTRAERVGEWRASQFSGRYVGEGYVHDLDDGKGAKTLTFHAEIPAGGRYEVWLAYVPHANRAASVPVTVFSAEGEKSVAVDMRANPPIEGRFLPLGRYRFEFKGQAYVLISNEGTKGHVVADAVLFIFEEQADRFRTTAAPVSRSAGGSAPSSLAARITMELNLEKELHRLRSEGPHRERVISVEDLKEVRETRVHIRGSVHTLGQPVPRGFLQVASHGPGPVMPAHESGRRELAAWLASADNPLTSRVIVNRVWHWLFGAGLVRTVDNFGTTGELPSHPELLDNLAIRFMEDGWSIKSLIRRIVLSRTYRLSSVDDPHAHEADPENRLLWQMNRRRLDAECLRDTILQVCGQLQLVMSGRSFPEDLAVDYGYKETGNRRSVYVPVFRNALPEIFEVFDFADPSMVVGRRDVSTVAPQALFMMNHPFILEQSRHAARRLLAEPGLDDPRRIARAYMLALGRSPTDAERRIALRYLDAREGPDVTVEERWAGVFHALFASADFRYVN